MNRVLIILTFIMLAISSNVYAAHKEGLDANTISQERYNAVCKWGIFNPPECRKKISKTTDIKSNKDPDCKWGIFNPPKCRKKNIEKKNKETKLNSASEKTKAKEVKQIRDPDCKWGLFNPPKCRKNYKGTKNISINEYEIKENQSVLSEGEQNISMYTGTFDILDKEGDEQTNLVGIEHKNESLFRDTWFGRFSPTTGGFVTGKSSIYLYTGIEADYNLGFINISPSFSPGYYRQGDGKDLGSALEFKSEIKLGFNIFENSNLGYSYSHISNNDWGRRNPGTDNQSITFSKNF